ncbi:MAG: hypothetical protein ACREDS_07425, partial [Limisphaerales bacterium]
RCGRNETTSDAGLQVDDRYKGRIICGVAMIQKESTHSLIAYSLPPTGFISMEETKGFLGSSSA